MVMVVPAKALVKVNFQFSNWCLNSYKLIYILPTGSGSGSGSGGGGDYGGGWGQGSGQGTYCQGNRIK